MNEFPPGQERLRILIEAYGADPACWPSAERTAAQQQLAQVSDALRTALDQARQVDRLLDCAPDLEVSWPLRARVLAAAPLPRGRQPVWVRHRVVVGAGLAAACAAGVAFGMFAAPTPYASRVTTDLGAVSALLISDNADAPDG